VHLRVSTIAYTATALIAFAANSVLTRMALREAVIDPAAFSFVRFGSGAATLVLLALRAERPSWPLAGSWRAAAALALYALSFAFSYTQLSAGTGALIMFGCVQVVMLVVALGSGERPRATQWAGLVLALIGLITLVFPGLTAPPLTAAIEMASAGVCWGLYTLLGRRASSPLLQTTGNFVRAVPIIGLAGLATLSRIHVEPRGALLAVASGALASGLGYVAWYSALRGLSSVRAAVVQLAVPLLAAVGGVFLLTETFTVRLLVSTVLVLGGIAMAIGRSGRG
jgi:drug/metabolite transporter (DMT)-like permease